MAEFLAILNGFVVLFAEPMLLVYLAVGFLVGVIFGAIPGLTSTLAITLILPMTYSMSMIPAVVMCMGIYMAGLYAGSITATTINIPGVPSSMMTAIEGHALMKQGHGARALGQAALASSIGGTIGALLLMLVSPLAVKLALLVRTPGKFSLLVFALVVIGLIDKENYIKGLVVMVLGLMIGTIGFDVVEPIARFTFGSVAFMEGVDFVPLIIGVFAISELLLQAEVSNADFMKLASQSTGLKIRRRDFFPTREDWREIGWFRYVKSALIGYFIGALPGAGGSMAGFVSYAEAKRSSSHPEQYGHGSIEGLACIEAANNAVCGGALVPMLSFGIPGDGATAIILGVLMVYGLIPGPELMTTQLHMIAPMYAALFIAALVLLPLSLFLFGPYYVKIVRINRLVLYSGIALISIMGAYSATYSIFQLFVVLVIGVMMYALRKQGYPSVPFVLAALLGPMAESYLRRSLEISQGNPLIFFTQFDSLFFLLLTAVFAAFLLKRINV